MHAQYITNSSSYQVLLQNWRNFVDYAYMLCKQYYVNKENLPVNYPAFCVYFRRYCDYDTEYTQYIVDSFFSYVNALDDYDSLYHFFLRSFLGRFALAVRTPPTVPPTTAASSSRSV